MSDAGGPARWASHARSCPERRGGASRLIASGLILLLAASGCALVGVDGPVVPREPIFYPSVPEQPRIQFLASYSKERDVAGPGSAFRRFILGPQRGGKLAKPYGVAIADGKIFVCDTRVNAVVIFDLVNRSVEALGRAQRGRLRKPINIAIDEDGRRYVADAKLGRVMVYGADNQYLTAFGDPKSWAPTDVKVRGRRLYVLDVKAGHVMVLEKETGEELRRFGEGTLGLPTNLDVDVEGNVYVTDTGNARVLKFDPRGRMLEQFGSLGRYLGQFVRPKGLAVDREERVYVADAAFQNVQIFDRKGKLLLFFGEAGNHPGGLNMPAKIAIDYENVDLFADRVAPGYRIEYLILVSSQFGRNKVNVYGFLADGDQAD